MRRAYEAGVADGQSAAISSIVQAATKITGGVQLFANPVAIHSAHRRERAPQGHVQAQVLQVIGSSPNGIAQAQIIPAGRDRLGFEIKPSSMRMALPALETAGKIFSRDGKWFLKGNEAP